MSFTKDKLVHLWGKITGLFDTVNDKISDLDSRKVDTEVGKSLISDTEIERLATLDNYDDSSIKTQIEVLEFGKANKSDVYTKTETDKQITDEIAKIVADAPEDFDTLKEMSDWISSHEGSAAEMNSAIQQNTTDIGVNTTAISNLQGQIDNKVNKIDGKGLSTNDFDDDYKSKLDDLGDASTKAVTTTVDTSTNLPTSSAVKTYVDESIASSGGGGASSNYLGTITQLSNLSNTAKKGSFYRVSTAWEGVHVNDTIMAEKDNPEQLIDGTNWSLLHNEENTDKSVTSVLTHYTPIKAETISAADGKLTDITNSATGTQVVTGVEMDEAGHITGVTSVALKASGAGGSGIDRYINAAAFNDDSTSSQDNPLKMTLTRVGEENDVEVVANLPKVSSSTAGVVPKGTDVTEQTETTKFLREDGTWSIPSYPTTLPASDTTDEYSSEGTAPVSGKAVAAAIGTLDVEGEASIDAGKTIVSWTQSNGIVNITTQDISINKSQIKDFPTEMTPSEHNQSSNTINAMTDYEKATTVSPITVDDSLNVAIGKLEKALDEKQQSGDYANADHTHDEYVNQNAFSNFIVGDKTITADTTTDTLKLISGDNITITTDESGDEITISAKDHPTYTSRSAGLYKITVDGMGHVSDVSEVVKKDITDLGIPESDTDTHYESKNVVTDSTISKTNTDVGLSNGNVYLNSVENDVVTSSHRITGSGATTVTTDSNGNIIISSTDNDTTYDVATQSKNGLMSSVDKTKLDGIEEGANNYTLPESTASTLGGVKTGNNITNTNGTISIVSKNVTDALGYTPIDSKLKGANNGVAELGNDGKVLSTQLPTVDSVVTENSDNTVKSSGIYEYVNSSISTNTAYFRGTFDNIDALNAYSGAKTLNDYAFVKSVDEVGNNVYSRYKWNGDAWGFEYNLNNSSFTAEQWATINSGMVSADKTKLDDITAGATKTEASETNGNIKINGSEVTVYTHPTGTNPHGTTKSDVGLGDVGNFKAVSTVASQGLTDIEKKNARENIGAGTSSFSGSYNDLTDKLIIDDVLSNTSTNVPQTKIVKEAIDSLQTNKANVSDLDNYMLKSEITAITNDEIDAIMAE